jgi:filamentous hemagglutinin family protein
MKIKFSSKQFHRARAAASRKWPGLAAVFFAAVGSLKLSANPAGMTVRLGTATAQTSGAQLNLTVSQAAFLNWSSFNIQAGETTTFIQPSANSVVLNEIGGANPSQIFGNLNANGTVILANANGFYFGPNSMIKVGGDFIATTAPITPDFGSGSSWTFTGMPPLKSIINYGSIQVGNGRSLFLIAENIRNKGSLNAPGGNIGLAAGQTVLVSERPDGRGLSASVQVPSGSVNNLGQITADAGTIALQAQVVNQNGIIQANSVQNQNGVIELIGSDQLTLGAKSQIIASGDNSPSGSAGGNVTLQSGNTFRDSTGSQIVTTGGAQGGNGGNVEISAPSVLSLNSGINARAQAGWTAGKFLLDPDYIILDMSGSGSAGNGTVLAGSNPGSTLDLNVNSAFANLAVSQIILQAAYDITLAGNTSWNLSGTIGKNFGGVTSGQLTLEAGRNIIFGNGSKISDANNWSVSLDAGYNFANNTVQSGYGNIYLNGGSGLSGKGSIQLSQGSINLTAGNSVVVGPGCQLMDAGGTIGLYAPTINQNGLIQADSVGNQHGIIELVAADQLTLGANSQIFASGDNSPAGSAGGNVTLQSGNIFSDHVGGKIITTGGANGGNGGNIEISAPEVSSLNSIFYANANSGWLGGVFTLGAANLALGASGNAAAWNGSSSTLSLNVNKAFNNNAASAVPGFSQIILEAIGSTSQGIFTPGNITLNTSATWNLGKSTGSTVSQGNVTPTLNGQLTLEAGGNIIFGNGSKITDANNWSASLLAGYDFVNNAIQSGVGNIYLNNNSGGNTGGGTIQTAAGSINLFAGESILAGSGSVYTTLGGSIFADALAGNINTGSFNGGNGTSQKSNYSFTSTGANPSTILGGFATAAGGNVTLIAGNNIDSTPTVPQNQWPGASGAYGSGNVTIIAGNQITGNYNLANGVGTLLAGVQVSSAQAGVLQNPNANPTAYIATLNNLETEVTQASNPNGNIGGMVKGSLQTVTLSLIQGSWNAWAANNIYLKEVNNPNGAFNSSSSSQAFLFNYAPDAAANFWAGNAIELVGNNLARPTSQGKILIIYAPILSLNAGAGGITIDKSIILYPSSEGSLQIITRDGGSLSSIVSGAASATPTLNGITMSDSDSTDYTTFASEHDYIHLNDANPHPVYLDISGDINSFSLTVPTFAEINVVGDAYNFGFTGQNLGSSQTTSINVGQTAKVNMENLGLLNPATDSGLTVGGDITYQPFSGANQNVTLGNQGLSLSGPGNFTINARNIDLGVSGGINVLAPDAALAAISPYGANLAVTTSGNLEMTSSAIANYSLLGGITLNVGVNNGGILDVGGTATGLSAGLVKGIITTSGGNISITAGGNVNVDGSRIAAYDGGNIDVTSQNGNVDAGAGGQGSVSFTALELVKPDLNDPTTWYLLSIPAQIPLSGILATTVAGYNTANNAIILSDAQLGNITVNAPNGSIKASSGGILQIAFNAADTKDNFISLTAGHDITATGSGVLGYNIQLKAGGDITGLIFGSQSVKINSQNNVNVTVVSGGNVDINASGAVSGTVISGGSLDVSGGSITAALIAESVSASGDTSGANMGIPQNVAKDNAETADDASTVASKTDDQGDEETKKKGKGIALAQKTGRVTIVLPPKQQQPKAQTPDPRT